MWAYTWDGGDDDELYAVAVDSGGNIYCAGYTYSFGTGNSDALLLKYDSSGVFQWARTWNGGDTDEVYAVAVDPWGNVYCAGYTYSFGTGNSDALLLKYSSSGAVQWAKTWSGSDGNELYAVAVDSTGNVCLGGITYSYTGAWQDVTGVVGTSPGTVDYSPPGVPNTVSGTAVDDPPGTDSDQTGIQTGADGSDALLLKNW